MAKQIYYNNLRVKYWSSTKFLGSYFNELEFSEPYSEAFGSISQAWVVNPWRNKIKLIVFDFVKQHLKAYKTLPVGEYTFTVEWKSKNLPWLKKCLKEKQVIIFPDFKKDSELLSVRI
jgi:hypothetical protein